MHLSRLPLAACSALALFTASPALAFSGYTVSHALRTPSLSSAKIDSKTSKNACTAGQSKDRAGVIGSKTKPAPVACEMPPRSQGLVATEGTAAAGVG